MDERERRVRDKSGKFYVYVFKSAHRYKIGHTDQVRGRLGGISTSTPLEVEVIKYYEFETRHQARGFERHLHRKHGETRMRNKITGKVKEWFKLNAQDLALMDYEYMKYSRPPKAIPERLKEAFAFSELLKERMRTAPRTL